MHLKIFFVAPYFFLVLHLTLAEESDILYIAKITEMVEFTGVTDEINWEAATTTKIRMYTPNFSESPNKQSEVLLGYDKQYLWGFARLHYADPSKILTTSKKRNEESKNSDSFRIILDTYDDNQSGLAFFTNPSGQRIDYAISNEANLRGPPGAGGPGGNSVNYSWNTFEDVKTARIADGWSVEMCIPFSSLRFQNKDRSVQMGLILSRSISYRTELDTYPEINPQYGVTTAMKPTLARAIVNISVM